MNSIYMQDIEKNLNAENINWNKLNNKTIFVTGATGIIGKLLINTIAFAEDKFGFKCRIIILVRNYDKANKLFRNILEKNIDLQIIEGDILNEVKYDLKIDFIIHAASITNSKSFISNPIDVINTNIFGTENVLKLAIRNNIENFIYLSTMEVYGIHKKDKKIDENAELYLTSNDIRSCYPISKFMSENICFSYAKKYNFNVNILRLTQTFGAGVKYDDQRVFAEFARCVIEKKDIILHTEGKTKRNYLYTSDAVNAILTILLSNNVNNNIYNVANENSYCSIREMADMVAKINNIGVKIEKKSIENYGYAPDLYMNLDCEKIKKLNWKAKIELPEMFERLIKSMEEDRINE